MDPQQRRKELAGEMQKAASESQATQQRLGDLQGLMQRLQGALGILDEQMAEPGPALADAPEPPPPNRAARRRAGRVAAGANGAVAPE